MNKILFISNISNKITSFVIASITAAHSLNMDFYQAANWQDADLLQIATNEKAYDIKIKNVPISRNPLARTNLSAYKELVEFIKQESIDYIHCNTPVGGILGRLAGKKCKVKKVIYQAHGFHFYQGAPVKNWMLYYPVEKWLAHDTDALITINKEDFELAKTKLKLHKGGRVYYVPGVGIDVAQYSPNSIVKQEKRTELAIPPNAFVMISVGELNTNKNHRVIISAMKKQRNDKIHYVLCGTGKELSSLRQQAEQAGLRNHVHFLGFRKDVRELYCMADCFVMPSLREGLSRSMMEAMASGLPCIASRIRGNTDLLEDGTGGYLCEPTDVQSFAKAIEALCHDDALREAMGKSNLVTIQKFGSDTVSKEIRKIYETEFLGG